MKAIHILAEVSTQHGLDIDTVRSRSRKAAVVKARSEAIIRIRRDLGWSWPRIARFFGMHQDGVRSAAGAR